MDGAKANNRYLTGGAIYEKNKPAQVGGREEFFLRRTSVNLFGKFFSADLSISSNYIKK